MSGETPHRSPVQRAVGARLRELRKQRGLSMAQVGTRVGYTAGAIQAWEVGRAAARLDDLAGLARLYGVTLASLMPDAAGS